MALGRLGTQRTVKSRPHNAHAPECTRSLCSVESQSDSLDLDRSFFFIARQSLLLLFFRPIGVFCVSE